MARSPSAPTATISSPAPAAAGLVRRARGASFPRASASAQSRSAAPDATVRTIGGVSVPSRVEAASILLEVKPVDWLVEHSAAVAEVAALLAARMAERGIALDRAVVEAAALLHDVDKALLAGNRLLQLGHGTAGAAFLTERGYAELAPAVAHHPVTLLSDEARYADWAERASLEESVVAYADKRATRDVVTLDERFRGWEERHPERAESIRIARGRAERLEREVCAAAGVAPNDVHRLPWVAEAMQAVASAAR
jgi:putative nucleotidyltransferase with HDIG domain